jgi:hypothetical protein
VVAVVAVVVVAATVVVTDGGGWVGGQEGEGVLGNDEPGRAADTRKRTPTPTRVST